MFKWSLKRSCSKNTILPNKTLKKEKSSMIFILTKKLNFQNNKRTSNANSAIKGSSRQMLLSTLIIEVVHQKSAKKSARDSKMKNSRWKNRKDLGLWKSRDLNRVKSSRQECLHQRLSNKKMRKTKMRKKKKKSSERDQGQAPHAVSGQTSSLKNDRRLIFVLLLILRYRICLNLLNVTKRPKH